MSEDRANLAHLSAIVQHAAARLGLADRYQAGGVATWRLGLEDPRVWAVLQRWREGRL